MKCSCCGSNVENNKVYYDYKTREIHYKGKKSFPVYDIAPTIFLELLQREGREVSKQMLYEKLEISELSFRVAVSKLKKAVLPLDILITTCSVRGKNNEVPGTIKMVVR